MTCVVLIKQNPLHILVLSILVFLLCPAVAHAVTTDQKYYPHLDTSLMPTNAILIESAQADNPGRIQTAAPRQDAVSVYTKDAASLSAESTSTYEQMVLSAFPDAPVMLRICIAESHCDPTAKNPHSSATGLFQVLRGTAQAYGCGDQTIAEESIACARKIYDKEGTVPWLSSSDNW